MNSLRLRGRRAVWRRSSSSPVALGDTTRSVDIGAGLPGAPPVLGTEELGDDVLDAGDVLAVRQQLVDAPLCLGSLQAHLHEQRHCVVAHLFLLGASRSGRGQPRDGLQEGAY